VDRKKRTVKKFISFVHGDTPLLRKPDLDSADPRS